jgi:hypothetical protein
MSEQRPYIKFERKYWIDPITSEDVKFIVRLFGQDKCQFRIHNEVVNVSAYGRIMPTAGRRESSVIITFSLSELDKFVFFDLRFPEAHMMNEAWWNEVPHVKKENNEPV